MPNYNLRERAVFRGQVDSYSHSDFTLISLFNLRLNYIYLSYINQMETIKTINRYDPVLNGIKERQILELVLKAPPRLFSTGPKCDRY